jgi:hypothetical protein
MIFKTSRSAAYLEVSRGHEALKETQHKTSPTQKTVCGFWDTHTERLTQKSKGNTTTLLLTELDPHPLPANLPVGSVVSLLRLERTNLDYYTCGGAVPRPRTYLSLF